MDHSKLPSKKFIGDRRFHLYTIIGSLVYTSALGLITKGKLEPSSFAVTFGLMVVQVEIFAWIGLFVFRKMEYNTVQEFIRMILYRLAVFYAFVIVIAVLMFVMVSAILSYRQGINMNLFFQQLPEKELRGFIVGSSIGLLTGTVIIFFLELIAAIKRAQQLAEEKMRYHYETLKNQSTLNKNE